MRFGKPVQVQGHEEEQDEDEEEQPIFNTLPLTLTTPAPQATIERRFPSPRSFLMQSPNARPLTVTDQQTTDFLLATNPCLANLPANMREGIRDSLQQRVDSGELTEADLKRFAATALSLRDLGD